MNEKIRRLFGMKDIEMTKPLGNLFLAGRKLETVDIEVPSFTEERRIFNDNLEKFRPDDFTIPVLLEEVVFQSMKDRSAQAEEQLAEERKRLAVATLQLKKIEKLIHASYTDPRPLTAFRIDVAVLVSDSLLIIK